MITITNQDLLKNKYSIDVLEYNMEEMNIDIKYVLSTQILTAEFCVNYILNDDYAYCEEDTYICEADILDKQPHITNEELNNAKTG